jgi:polysaccharide export outer membrane protein
MKTSPETLLLAGVLALAAGCSHLGDYVWVDDLKEPSASGESEYLIAPGDVLNVRVFNQEGMSGRARVRTDGKISLPFLNDVEAAGHTPPALAARLQIRLKEFINNPVVTVSLEEAGPIQVSVLGEVAHPGAYAVHPRSSVLHALAAAGGLTQYASGDRIFVLRRGAAGAKPPLLRVRFRYESLAHADGRAAAFRMRDGDVLVVE